ncbi:ATP-binding protein [Salmonirosea aquatica]
MSFFVDTTAALTLSEVQKQSFSPVETNNFRIPFSNHTYWYRLTLKNVGADEEKWYLSWDDNPMEQIDFYVSEDSSDRNYHKTSGGAFVAKEQRKYLGTNPYFTFELGDSEQKTIYLRARTQRGQRVRVILYRGSSFFQEQAKGESRAGFISGLVALRLFYIVLLAIFGVREYVFRAYSTKLAIHSLSYWGLTGDLGEFLTNAPFPAALINIIAPHLIPISYVIAIKALLPIGRFPPYVRYLLNGITLLVIALSVAIVLDYRWYWLLISTWLVLFSQGVVLLLYALSMFRRYSIDWYYSVPFLMGLISYFFWQMSLLGILNAPWVFQTSSLLFIGEIFVFGLFLGKIIRNYERVKTMAQQKLEFTEAQTEKLRELDTLKTNFFANISHEFRTPLTLLVGPLADFKNKYPAESLIPAMQRNVRRLHDLINQLLDLSKIEAGQLKPTLVRADLVKFLRPVLASFESLAQSRNILFHYEQNRQEKEALFDPDQLEKIVTNLLSNAFKFTPDNGRIEVMADYSARELLLTVRDSGIGIPAARLPHIFDRFYQVEAQDEYVQEGTGIGLSLVKELVGVLRGNIEVESEPERGSTFKVRLPIDPQTWAGYPIREHDVVLQPSLPENPGDGVPSGNSFLSQEAEPDQEVDHDDMPLLLVVEDNPDLRAYIRSIFEKKYRVIEATDGKKGLSEAYERIPDLVVCDVMMPRLDGFGFCKALKADFRTSHIPVIMLTAKATLDDRLEGLKLGADDYLTKPFDRQELSVRVQNLLKQRELLRQKYSQQMNEPSTNTSVKDTEQVEKYPVGDEPVRDHPFRDYPVRDEFLEKAIEVVNEHLADSSFSIEEFCQTMQVSRTQLHRKLKALTGQNSTEFIRNFRLRRAAELLSTGRYTVSEAAYQTGFESLSYFSKSFHELMGIPPSEWGAIANYQPNPPTFSFLTSHSI